MSSRTENDPPGTHLSVRDKLMTSKLARLDTDAFGSLTTEDLNRRLHKLLREWALDVAYWLEVRTMIEPDPNFVEKVRQEMNRHE